MGEWKISYPGPTHSPEGARATESLPKPPFYFQRWKYEGQLGTIDFNWTINGVFAHEFDASSFGSATVVIFEEDPAVVEFGENNIPVTGFRVASEHDAVSSEKL